MTNSPKNHHFVPRAYIKRFSNDKKHVYVLWKKNMIIPKRPVNIENICAERDFYTLINSNNEKDTCIEESLAVFEDKVPNMVFLQIPPNLIAPYRNNGIILNMEQKKKIVDAIAIQIARGKSTREYGHLIIDDFYKDEIEEINNKLDNCPELANHFKNLVENEDRIKNNVLVEGPIIEMLKGWRNSLLIKNLQERICFVLINSTNVDFITSDEPVLVCDGLTGKTGIYQSPLGNKNSIVYYPLDSKHMIALYTKEYCGYNNNITGISLFLNNNDINFINTTNTAHYRQCNRCLIAKNRNSLLQIKKLLDDN